MAAQLTNETRIHLIVINNAKYGIRVRHKANISAYIFQSHKP